MTTRLCPRCRVNPSRHGLTHRGRPPLCRTCSRLAKAKKVAYWRERRAARPVAMDLPPEEIERRYQAALMAIRRRA